MKSTLRLGILYGDGMKSGSYYPVEMTCVHGPPTVDPEAKPIEPLVKEMHFNGRALDYNERKLILEMMGGEEALRKYLESN